MTLHRPSTLLALLLPALLGGCTSYTAPGRPADMTAFRAAQAQTTDEKIRGAYAAEPLAQFPASIAVIRVQEPGYRNYAGYSGVGTGRYSVVTRREVEKQEQFDEALRNYRLALQITANENLRRMAQTRIGLLEVGRR